MPSKKVQRLIESFRRALNETPIIPADEETVASGGHIISGETEEDEFTLRKSFAEPRYMPPSRKKVFHKDNPSAYSNMGSGTYRYVEPGSPDIKNIKRYAAAVGYPSVPETVMSQDSSGNRTYTRIKEDAYTLSELNEAFEALGLNTYKYTTEYLAEELGFVNENILDAGKQYVRTIANTGAQLGRGVGRAAGTFGKGIANTLTSTGASLFKPFDKTKGIASNIGGNIGSATKNYIGGAIGTSLNTVKELGKGAINTTAALGSGIANTLKSVVKKPDESQPYIRKPLINEYYESPADMAAKRTGYAMNQDLPKPKPTAEEYETAMRRRSEEKARKDSFAKNISIPIKKATE
jgi:hypothetical protein